MVLRILYPHVFYCQNLYKEQNYILWHHDDVEYEMKGFVEKNRDSVNQEHLAILKASEVCKEIGTWNVIIEAL